MLRWKLPGGVRGSSVKAPSCRTRQYLNHLPIQRQPLQHADADRYCSSCGEKSDIRSAGGACLSPEASEEVQERHAARSQRKNNTKGHGPALTSSRYLEHHFGPAYRHGSFQIAVLMASSLQKMWKFRERSMRASCFPSLASVKSWRVSYASQAPAAANAGALLQRSHAEMSSPWQSRH